MRMARFKKFLYLGYYIKNFDRKKFREFLVYICDHSKKTKSEILVDIIKSSVKHNISFLEYAQFGFYCLDDVTRRTYAGTGYMYEYQRVMNPPEARRILDDKTLFYRSYRPFIKHKIADIKDLLIFPDLSSSLVKNPSGRIVFKTYNGKCGKNVVIKNTDNFRDCTLIDFMLKNKFDLAEEFIVQHPLLMELSSSAVNTVRIITQINSSREVEILGCRLRISVNSTVDNMAAGNLAAPVDEMTGCVNGPGVYSDITKPDAFLHPVTEVRIVGFQVPFWEEIIDMARAAARLHPQNRSVGWDIAVTLDGPDLIEGNHDWCKLLWQLPVRRGLKPLLEKQIDNYSM